MSNGIVIVAFDTDKIAYTKIAEISGKLATQALDLPVTLITNVNVTSPVFDQIIVVGDIPGSPRTFLSGDSQVTINWKNQTRPDVYELSPYDTTLLIDADYFILSDNLLHLFNTNLDFAVYTNAIDIGGQTNLTGVRLNPISTPMVWATVVFFKKSTFSKSIFDMMRLVRDNYHYYSLLYNFDESRYRNDYALSISLHALAGYGSGVELSSIPGKLLTLTTNVISINENDIIFKTTTGTSKISNSDIHIMDKFLLQDDSFLTGLEQLAKIR